VQLCSSDLGALHRRDRVRGDEPVLRGLAQGRAEDPPDLSDRGRGQPPLLHPGEDSPDVAGPELGELDAADDRNDLPADVALVSI